MADRKSALDELISNSAAHSQERAQTNLSPLEVRGTMMPMNVLWYWENSPCTTFEIPLCLPFEDMFLEVQSQDGISTVYSFVERSGVSSLYSLALATWPIASILSRMIWSV